MGYTTIYLLMYAVGAISATQNVSTALGVVEGSTYPAPIAVTVKTFVDLIKYSNIFIDKSAIIKELFRKEQAIRESRLRFFVRPTGWGKSVMLNMIKIFLEIHVDPQTQQIVPNDQTTGYRLFEHGQITLENSTVRRLRDRLLISEDAAFMLQHQGQYIVVQMNLGGLKATNVIELKKGMAVRARLAFKGYKYDYIATALGADPHLIDEMARRIRAEQTDWTPFSQICDILKKYYQRELFVLVEDYDDAMIELLGQSVPNKVEVVKQFLTSYRGFFRMLEEQRFYKKVIFTGATRIIFDSDQQKSEVDDEMLGKPLYLYHGFNDKEMDTIFDHLHFPATIRKAVTDRYSGYQYNEEEQNSYNPRSVVNFLATGKVDDYWTPKPSIDVIFTKTLLIPTFRYILLSFEVFSLCETKDLYNGILWHKEFLDNGTIDKLVRYLENPDYVIKNENHSNPILYYYEEAALEVALYMFRGHGYLTRSYDIPNEEVDTNIRTKLLSFYSSHLRFRGTIGDRGSTLHLLCEKLRPFLLSNETRSRELENLFLNFLNDLEVFNGISHNFDALGHYLWEVYAACDVLNFITAYMKGFFVGYSGALPADESGVVEAAITYKLPGQFIVIHMIIRYSSGSMIPVAQKFATFLPTLQEEAKKAFARRIGIYYEPNENHLAVLPV